MQLKMEASHSGKSKQPSSPQATSTTSAASSSPAVTSPGTSTSPVQQHANGSSSTGVASNGAKFRPRSTTTPSSTLSAPASSNPWSQQQQYRFNSTLPLRILVLKDLVGAIIGRGGNTIKQITQETHARVDVHRKESSTANENVIMIYGNPENCSQACRRILEVMQQEARSLNRPEDFVLKILASNNLIGRIIGKGGSTIKRIMQQTETKITVSSANLASQMNLERIISIVGSLENMCKAEGLITHKLRQCFESDMYQYQQSLIYASLPSSMPPMMGGHPGSAGLSSMSAGGGYPAGVGHPGQASMGAYTLAGASSALAGRGSMLTAGSPGSSGTAGAPPSHHIHSLPSPTAPPPAAFYGGYTALPYTIYPSPGPGSAASGMAAAYGSLTGPSAGAPYMSMGGGYMHPGASVDNVKETSTVYIPNSVVGAIIGRGGQTIRDMITNSGASIKVAQQSEGDDPSSVSSPSPTASSSSQESSRSVERRVTIIGTANSQYQAQYFVFQKVLFELYNQAASSSSTSPPIGLYGDPAILKVEILVPTHLVRRIIGKNGSVIQELQRTTGTTIKLSKDTQHHNVPATAATSTAAVSAASTAPPNGASDVEKGGSSSDTSKSTAAPAQDDLTAVHIIGEFTSNFYAQRQIRLIVMRSTSSGPPSTQQSPQLGHHQSSGRSGKGQTAGAASSATSKSSTAKSPTSETSDTSKTVKDTSSTVAETTSETSSSSTIGADIASVATSESSSESKTKIETTSTSATGSTS